MDEYGICFVCALNGKYTKFFKYKESHPEGAGPLCMVSFRDGRMENSL